MAIIKSVHEFSLWLLNKLTGLSEADSETLSNYVIALLKKDKSETDKTKEFTDDIFDIWFDSGLS